MAMVIVLVLREVASDDELCQPGNDDLYQLRVLDRQVQEILLAHGHHHAAGACDARVQVDRAVIRTHGRTSTHIAELQLTTAA